MLSISKCVKVYPLNDVWEIIMKMTIQKTYKFTIDTAAERKRINKCFEDRKEIRDKLLQLMDLVEAEKWEEAERTLNDEWWNGRDEDLECPRVEFIGLLNAEGSWDTYANLIWRMVRCPERYKVIKKK